MINETAMLKEIIKAVNNNKFKIEKSIYDYELKSTILSIQVIDSDEEIILKINDRNIQIKKEISEVDELLKLLAEKAPDEVMSLLIKLNREDEPNSFSVQQLSIIENISYNWDDFLLILPLSNISFVIIREDDLTKQIVNDIENNGCVSSLSLHNIDNCTLYAGNMTDIKNCFYYSEQNYIPKLYNINQLKDFYEK